MLNFNGRVIAQAVSRRPPTAGLLWTKWHWGRFSPSTSVSPANSHSTNCSTIIFIYRLGLVQQAKQWPTYQVDSVLHHEKMISFILMWDLNNDYIILIRTKIKFALQVFIRILSKKIWSIFVATYNITVTKLGTSPLHVVQTGSGNHPASCPMGTGVFTRLTRPRREGDHSPPSIV
jgi:hypothetical protein